MIAEQGLARVRTVVRRRRLAVLWTAGGVLVAAAAVILSLRPMYKASAVLRALESQPAREYVAPTVVEQIGDRLRTLRVAIMSRPLLERVATDLELPQKAGLPVDRVIEDMRSRLEVKVEGEDTFLLVFEDPDPDTAREVVNRIAAGFVERQVNRRAQIASQTEQAIAQEVERLGPELEERERIVREFKLAHYGSLPEQQEENMRLLDQTQLEINIQTTNQEMQEERRRQILLAAISALRRQEDGIRSQLTEARTRYTEEHPEVRRIGDELDRVRTKRLAEERALRSGAEVSPEMASLDTSIGHTKGQLGLLRKRQEDVRARLDKTAQNGQELARLQIGLDGLRAKYTAAVSKLHDAQLAAGIEANLRDLRYDTVEAAVRPALPARPNKPLLLVGAIIAAMLLGLGAGFARESYDDTVHAEDEVAAAGIPLPVLAAVPRHET